MLRTCTLLAITVTCLFFLPAALPAGLLYDPKPGHPWDQARDIFYIRHFSTGETFEDPRAFSPPYTQYIAFVQVPAFHEQVLARLSAVEKLPPAQMEAQSPSRRLLFLCDLWPVFERLQRAQVGVKDDKEATAKATARRDELVGRVARIMKRLELTDEEVRDLPDVFKMIGEKKLYPKAFDPAKPQEPFFPADLLDKDGPWITFSRTKEPSAGGAAHMGGVQDRSMFTLHLRTPDGREGGLKYIDEFTKSNGKQAVPPGTVLALLRRAVVPAKGGKLLVTPFVESLQLIVVAPPNDSFFKFVLDRPEFLAGRPSLKPRGKDDAMDTTGFESAILWPHPIEPRTDDVNGETLIAAKYKTLQQVPKAQNSCVFCHGNSVGSRIMGNFGDSKAAFLQDDPGQTAVAVVKKKEASEGWKAYLKLREESARLSE